MTEHTQTAEASPIEFDRALADVINSAAGRGVPVAVAYVDRAGRPQLSPRGTVQVHSRDQLALWARSPGLPDALATNRHVALLYQDLANRTFYQFGGRARGVDDQAERDRIFENSPPQERAQDPDRTGAAIIVDVDTVRGLGPEGMIVMVRPDQPPARHRSPIAAAASRDGAVMTHMLIVADIDRSVRFYRDVLGAAVLREQPPAMLAFHNGWLIINVGGGPTPDKPTITVAPPDDPDRVSSFLNIRVADIDAIHKQWSQRGAQFLTAPLDNHGAERRCYLRDPDGYLIEVGQTTGAASD
jgi:catechol 2,3-dioxygenase-like lactoylglutathione lyase family enzyme